MSFRSHLSHISWIPLYVVFNRVMAGYMVYAITLPLWSNKMYALFPHLWQCAFLRITERPCPLCGVTRDVKTWFETGTFGAQNPLTTTIVLIFSLLFLYRVTALFRFHRFPFPAQKILISLDLGIHAALLISLAIMAG